MEHRSIVALSPPYEWFAKKSANGHRWLAFGKAIIFGTVAMRETQWQEVSRCAHGIYSTSIHNFYDVWMGKRVCSIAKVSVWRRTSYLAERTGMSRWQAPLCSLEAMKIEKTHTKRPRETKQSRLLRRRTKKWRIAKITQLQTPAWNIFW